MCLAHALDEEESRNLTVLYRAIGINKRHSVIKDYASINEDDWSFFPKTNTNHTLPSTSDRAALYRKYAIDLSTQAVQKCLAKSDFKTNDITHLITVSCTGMYAPGLDFDLINAFNLSKNIDRTAINFMGCYAAITATKRANDICLANAGASVLVVCVELCTIHFHNEKTDDNLLANAIFSDGAAAFLMGDSAQSKGLSLRPLKFFSDLLPKGQKDMAWNIGDFGFEMKLSAYVPNLIQEGIKSLIQNLTKDQSNKANHFAIHPGGKRILQVIEQELKLPREKNSAAHEVLRNFGNMSSPTVLFVLENLLESLTQKNQGETVMSLAFGPGLTLESMLLEIN